MNIWFFTTDIQLIKVVYGCRHSEGNAVAIIHVVLDVTCLIDIFFILIYNSITLSYQAENVDLIYKHLVIVFDSVTHYFNWNMFKYVYIEKVYFRFKHCMPENEILCHISVLLFFLTKNINRLIYFYLTIPMAAKKVHLKTIIFGLNLLLLFVFYCLL